MLGYTIAAMASAAAIYTMVHTADDARLDDERRETAILAGGMLNYAKRVSAYAVAHPTVTGSVQDGALDLPVWLQRPPAVQNYLDAGMPYTYFPSAPGGLASAIVVASKATVHVGIKQGSSLRIAGGQASFVLAKPLPSAIPDGAVVVVP